MVIKKPGFRESGGWKSMGLLDKGASHIVPNWGTLLLIEQLCIILITAYADR